jgi:hypothetical protein
MDATTTMTERAKAIGERDRDVYLAEFGGEPAVGEVGDWDATGVSEMWCDVSRDLDDVTAPEAQDTYRECRVAYLKALFATEDVA